MGNYRIALVGEANYQAAIARSRNGEYVDLLPEPSNRHDRRAVLARTERGQLIGYLPRDGWLTRVMIDEEKPVFATIEAITGGSGSKSHMGIVLLVAIGGDAEAAHELRDARRAPRKR